MSVAPDRVRVLRAVADRVPEPRDGTCVRVGVDGPDGAGKTMFADGLAAVLRERGRPVVRISLDDFHHVRAVRYRAGPRSPEGFWRDSYDYARFRADVLEPFGPHGSRRYRVAGHDLRTDAILSPEPQLAPPHAVLVVDGLFLHRDELGAPWDLSVFLDVPFTVTARRMALRDGTEPDPDHPDMQRYVGAQRIYFAACAPRERATVLVDNTDVHRPRILRG
ncbi:uridine kinase [Asanoa siamensis]|uniref:Uridine kinase n=1 Tax=Asanoa siamensis TaxID=926357 RepID=A0ABQ4D453_9ACTN|nr:uridine kinase [Asanoa siamensis]GIF78309.1 uridine kinase [Asanoa siamensis]